MTDLTDKPKRIQLSRRKGWRMPPNTVSVARGPGWRPYANPFVIGKDGDRDECIAKFREQWESAINSRVGLFGAVMQQLLKDIRGKNLACWCPLDQPCHADVLLELANPADAIERGDYRKEKGGE